MRLTLILAAIGAAFHTLPAHAGELPQTRFQHHDWELACDNTRTCRAAGYSAEEGDSLPLSVLFERKAGPDEPLVAELSLGDDGSDAPYPAALAMQIDGKAVGTVRLNDGAATLSRQQSQALLRAVAGSGVPTWRGAGRSWTLSGKGAAAVLLKMDEFQGRLGTPGAAIRKGTRPESGVLPPLPKPVVAAAPVLAGALAPLTGEARRQLLATLRKGLGQDEDCEDLEAIATGEEEFTYAALDGERMLVSARCWRGAYNEGAGYWVANRTPPYAPTLVTTMGTDAEAGTIRAAHKGRGIGDCWASEEWTWDGRRFVHSASATTGMCRGVPGGSWDLPTLVSEIRRSGAGRVD